MPFVRKNRYFHNKENEEVGNENGEEEESRQEKSSKKARIIVRNLPFKNLSEKILEGFFSEFGEIEEVKILRKDDGKFIGCGFVQFKKISSAAKAIRYGNQRELNGRKIIIDWALPKNVYISKVNHSMEKNTPVKVKIEEGEEENSEFDFCIDTKPDSVKPKTEKKNSDSDNDSDDNNNDDDYDDSSNNSDNDGDDDVDDDDDDDDDGDGESNYDNSHEYSKNIKVESVTQKKCKGSKEQYEMSKSSKPSDAEDGKTVFIRNIPFSATNDDLKECVSVYGPVHYALICVDKLTEHSKGTGFVKFQKEESARQCVQDSNKIYIQESPLLVTFALTKENVENKKTDKKKVAKDSRNLYLVREGTVIAGSKAAAGVSASDMAKRLQLEQWKSQILKNLNMFVSKTRLVIHNLPPNYDDAKLRKLFLKFGNPKAVIREAKVMWEKKKLDAKGNHVSKEVGFVSFTDHEDALAALRNINNNPNIFSAKKRPIVAFSIENKEVLNRKQKRVEKSRAKLGITTTNDKLSKLNRKQRRFIKRRQKIIERRREAKKLKEGMANGTGAGEGETGEKETNKRKSRNEETEEKRKKQKRSASAECVAEKTEVESRPFSGVASEPGKKLKLRSRYNLKKQASIHKQTLKNEKAQKKLRKKKRIESMKQEKQKQGKQKLFDDEKLSKLIAKHRQSIQDSHEVKKWYEK